MRKKINNFSKKKETEVCRNALIAFGTKAQASQVIEEMAELMIAIHRYLHRGVSASHIAEEIADVRIMLRQLEMMTGTEKTIARFRNTKLTMLEERSNYILSKMKEPSDGTG